MDGQSRYDRLAMFRAAALQGILANPQNGADGPVIAIVAVKMADAMMAECDKRDLEAKKAERAEEAKR